MKKFTLYLFTVVLLASLVLSGCAKKTTAVRVATDASWPPFEMLDESTKAIIGYDVDIMNAIAEKEGFKVEFINVAFDPLLAGMAQCQYDASISAMTITDERKQSFAFSDPYFAAGQVVTVRADNTDITGKDSLTGKTAGAQIGTTGAIEVQNISGATLKTYDDIGLAFQDLMNGQIDAVVADYPLAVGYVNENTGKLKLAGEPFTNEFYGIAVCKTNTDLLSKINDGLAKIKADGTYDQLGQKWGLAAK